MKNKLILFEGIIGSGKSTTSQWLFRQLQQKGEPIFWCNELSTSHPFRRASDGSSSLSNDEFLTSSVQWWKDATELISRSDQLWILDCGPMQTIAMEALHRKISHDQILSAIKTTGQYLTPLSPTVYKFQHTQIETHIQQVFEKRGIRFTTALTDWTTNYDGSFWKDCDLLYEDAATLLSENVIYLDGTIGMDWTNKRFLKEQHNLTETSNSPPHDPTIVGEYKLVKTGIVCTIEENKSGLVISNLMEPLEQFTQLIPITPTSYYLSGQDVTLERTANGNLIVESGWPRLHDALLEPMLSTQS